MKLDGSSRCPTCKRAAQYAASMSPGVEPVPPEAGCMAVCYYCGARLVFGADLELRAATDA